MKQHGSTLKNTLIGQKVVSSIKKRIMNFSVLKLFRTTMNTIIRLSLLYYLRHIITLISSYSYCVSWSDWLLQKITPCLKITTQNYLFPQYCESQPPSFHPSHSMLREVFTKMTSQWKVLIHSNRPIILRAMFLCHTIKLTHCHLSGCCSSG